MLSIKTDDSKFYYSGYSDGNASIYMILEYNNMWYYFKIAYTIMFSNWKSEKMWKQYRNWKDLHDNLNRDHIIKLYELPKDNFKWHSKNKFWFVLLWIIKMDNICKELHDNIAKEHLIDMYTKNKY